MGCCYQRVSGFSCSACADTRSIKSIGMACETIQVYHLLFLISHAEFTSFLLLPRQSCSLSCRIIPRIYSSASSKSYLFPINSLFCPSTPTCEQLQPFLHLLASSSSAPSRKIQPSSKDTLNSWWAESNAETDILP